MKIYTNVTDGYKSAQVVYIRKAQRKYIVTRLKNYEIG